MGIHLQFAFLFLDFKFVPFISVLLKKVSKLESKELEKYKIDPLHLQDFDKLLDGVYIARRPTPTECFNRRDLIRIFNAIAKEIYGRFFSRLDVNMHEFKFFYFLLFKC